MRSDPNSEKSAQKSAVAPAGPAKRGRPSRRGAIFASALRLFRERGFHATSINDIGADAGVAGTAIYAHFATKQELLAEAIREGARRIRRGVEGAEESGLESLVRAYVRVVLENADMNACYVLESRNLDPEVREPLVRSERGLRALFRRRLVALRPELSRDEAQALVQMAIFGLVALCLHRTKMNGDELFELATSQMLCALQSPLPRSSQKRSS